MIFSSLEFSVASILSYPEIGCLHNPLPNYQNVPPPTAYTISSGLPESFIENSIQDIPENETEKLERKERELLAILEVEFMSIISDSSDDEIDPSSYQYISLIPHAPHLMM